MRYNAENVIKILTWEEHLCGIKKKHGARYIYPEYVDLVKGVFTKIFIVCKKHGSFSQNISNHKNGQNCPKCNLVLSWEDHLSVFITIHKDKYVYPKSVKLVRGDRTKINIVCSLHGKFAQNICAHKRGQGCPKCGIENKILPWVEHLKDIKKKHGNRYIYSECVDLIKGANTEISITCLEHGNFLQTISSHKRGSNCHKCSKMFSWAKHLGGIKRVHGNRYIYPKSVELLYGTDTKIFIECSEHGIFLQSISNHTRGRGCPKCCNLMPWKNHLVGFKKIHGTKYIYPESVDLIKGVHTKVDIQCNIHGLFSQRILAHKRGEGCPSCAPHGYSLDMPGHFYILELITENKKYMKVGITNRKVEVRLAEIVYNKKVQGKIIFEYLFEVGGDALNLEIEVKQILRNHQYRGEKFLVSGYSELYCMNPYNLGIELNRRFYR